MFDEFGNSLTYTEYENFLGKKMFGKPGRMLVGLWIVRLEPERAERFHSTMYSDWCLKTKRTFAQASPDFRRFEDLKMIECTEVDRARWYRRLPHPLWDMWKMLDATLSVLENPEEQRLFVPQPESVDKMVRSLVKIHAQTAPETPTPVQPTVVESKGAKRGWPGNYRKRGKHGELQCSRCKKWKAPGLFSPRPQRPGLYKSQCKACMAEVHRERYLTIKKIEALNSVGLVFTIKEGDDVAGLTCTVCTQPIEVGQEVEGHTRLNHITCPTLTP